MMVSLLLTAVGTVSANSSNLNELYSFDFDNLPTPFAEGVLENFAADFEVSTTGSSQKLILPTPGTEWLGYWDAGQIQLAGKERLVLTARVSETLSIEAAAQLFSLAYFGGEYVPLNPENVTITHDDETGELAITVQHTFRAEDAGKVLAALWLRFKNPGTNEGSVELLSLQIFGEPGESSAIDAESILKTPPLRSANIRMLNGVPAIFVDSVPITGTGWAHIITANVDDAELHQMVAETGGSLVRVVSALGESILNLYPDSWDGGDRFDFSYLDAQVGRVLKSNPNAKILLLVALDRVAGWSQMHPSATQEVTGNPDYLSTEWMAASRKAIRQFVAHVQTSSYAGAVIGYELFNGATMDCNFELPRVSPRALRDFRLFLRTKYQSDEELAEAWGLKGVTLETATQIPPEKLWELTRFENTLLLEPGLQRPAADTLQFRGTEYAQVVENFAREVKDATQNRALVGARTGDFLGNGGWAWKEAMGDFHIGTMMGLSKSRFLDFYDVQEPYPGREIGHGSGVPVLPIRGLALDKKLVFIQNDVRTHLSPPDAGYGRTKDLASTIAMQRRVFVNAMIGGAVPYLWQMTYHFNAPEMLEDYRRQEDILERAMKLDRSSGAEVAFVFDRDYRRYLGFDPDRSEPSRAFSMFDYIKFPWLRVGAPFDMVFLDQIESRPPYKVYVFIHTFFVSAEQRAMIERVTRRDGRVSIFVWANGVIDSSGGFSSASISDLTGIQVKLDRASRSWEMAPSDWFRERVIGVGAETPLGTLSVYDPAEREAGRNVFSPSFEVIDPEAEPIAFRPDGSVGAAVKKFDDYSVIYTASANVTEPILRFAMQRANAFSYSQSDAQLMINQSFLGIHTYATEDIALELPRASALYEVFRDEERPVSSRHRVAVQKNETYLFFRGSKNQWEQLAGKARASAGESPATDAVPLAVGVSRRVDENQSKLR